MEIDFSLRSLRPLRLNFFCFSPHSDFAVRLANLEQSYQQPDRFDDRKLWPYSQLEFQKPSTMDVVGFVLCLIACFGIIGLAVTLAGIGA